MARDPDSIERDIEQARNALAAALDELSIRANPKHFVESGKESLQAQLADPRIRLPLIGFGVLVFLLMVHKLFR